MNGETISLYEFLAYQIVDNDVFNFEVSPLICSYDFCSYVILL